MSAKKVTKQLSDEEKKELAALKARLAELEPAPVLIEEKSEELPLRNKIPLDEYIPVISLLPYRLNLATKEGGQGDIKKFTRFGEIKNILYKDLVDILETNRGFAEAGYFYILNPDVIRQHGLDDVYSKILTKEKIEEILNNNTDAEACVNLYNSANAEQQRVIVQLLVNRIKEYPNGVNLYTVDRISRLSGIDIPAKAQAEKVLEAELAGQTRMM